MLSDLKQSWKSLTIAFSIPVILVAGLSFTSVIEDLEFRAPLQIDFSLRYKLGLEPKLNTKIKILALDDDTARTFKRTSPHLADWQDILTKVSAYKPRVILIDKIFDRPEPTADHEGFVAHLKNLQTPVVIGSFAFPMIKGRKELKLDRPFGQLSAILSDGTSQADFDGNYPWLKEVSTRPYGAPENLVDAFAAIGHIIYDRFFLDPVLRFSEGRILQHISMFVTDGAKLRNGKLYVNDYPVPLNARGRLLINYLNKESFRPAISSMAPLAGDASPATAALPISPDDIVLILPSMYSGHTDWVQSPMGEIPGGLLLASMINANLEKKWLRIVETRAPFVIGATVLGGVMAILIQGALPFWLILAASIFAIAGSGIWAFSIGQLVLPWFTMSIGFILNAIPIFALKARIAEKEHYRMRQEFATAKLVQNQLFPPESASLGRMHVISKCEPAAECGGDFWNHFEVADGRQFLLIGDAVGHGMPAALVAATTHATAMTIAEVFKTTEPTLLSPAYILKHLNSVLVASFKSEITMTMFVTEISPDGQTIRYANAGHCQPFILNSSAPDGAGFQSLRSRGDPLGVDNDANYVDSTTKIQPGARIHYYTDGLIESRDDSGKILGMKKFSEHFKKCITQPADVAVKGIFELVKAYSKRSVLDDDGTILILETTPIV